MASYHQTTLYSRQLLRNSLLSRSSTSIYAYMQIYQFICFIRIPVSTFHINLSSNMHLPPSIKPTPNHASQNATTNMYTSLMSNLSFYYFFPDLEISLGMIVGFEKSKVRTIMLNHRTMTPQKNSI